MKRYLELMSVLVFIYCKFVLAIRLPFLRKTAELKKKVSEPSVPVFFRSISCFSGKFSRHPASRAIEFRFPSSDKVGFPVKAFCGSKRYPMKRRLRVKRYK